ncbi:hydrolase TatD [Leptolyngbya sp. 'hensonii']|uniref:TatD family hydrolase n=1 Tax=Leptolyngbya sp. 'hensonii' TaxID=1922337 RepID=UPI00094F8D28|nr:TatD family hydrolase [Leptolyngbya sp. 'hensonii']OLP15878.1 hydrolase TatD [Leptolyngbya sp. 'hensonii']
MSLVDIGVNLTHAAFDIDRPQVLERAIAAGVQTLILTGTTVEGSREAQALASQYPGQLYATAGVHPHDVRHCDEQTIPHLRSLMTHPAVVAIGECGLDFNRDYSPRPEQEQWFEAQLQLACELQLPLFLHEREAHVRFMEILKPYRDQLTAAVVHCFTGNADELRTYLDWDLHIGITGWICDERRGRHLQELVRLIPPNRLMLETDAPYLTPRTLRPKPKGGRNEPAFLTHVVQTVAQAIGKPVETVAQATTESAFQFFNLHVPIPAPPPTSL